MIHDLALIWATKQFSLSFLQARTSLAKLAVQPVLVGIFSFKSW